MAITGYVILIIVGSALVTFIPRVLPLVFLSKVQIPDWGINWLKHIPVAVMAALLAQELLLKDGMFSIETNRLELFAAVPTFLAALLSRSLLVTVLVGVFSMMVFRNFF